MRPIATATRVRVPPALKVEWRQWSLARRGEFIARIRAKLASPKDRPAFPFSANVEPFDYASEKAHAIAAQMNAGCDSRSARMKIKVCSQGVIWRGKLWFWVHDNGYCQGPYTREHGRPVLHHVIWKETHASTVPPSHVIRFADGNPNNHAPENLVLAHRNDLARENQAAALARKSRETTALLLDLAQNKQNHEHTSILSGLTSTR